jgi:hypothetical protein
LAIAANSGGRTGAEICKVLEAIEAVLWMMLVDSVSHFREQLQLLHEALVGSFGRERGVERDGLHVERKFKPQARSYFALR